jgi:amphi-Trp domain-containing protein
MKNLNRPDTSFWTADRSAPGASVGAIHSLRPSGRTVGGPAISVTGRDDRMPDVEIKRKVRLSREEAGQRLVALGTALIEGSKSEVDFDGESIRFAVADQLDWEFELEVDGDETEIEIELKWSDSPVAEPTSQPRRARATRGRAKT